MRLAKSDATVDEQRVVGTRRRFGNRPARRMRELIRRADDERVEGVTGIEAAGRRHRRRGVLVRGEVFVRGSVVTGSAVTGRVVTGSVVTGSVREAPAARRVEWRRRLSRVVR